jgi:hypothetical protein
VLATVRVERVLTSFSARREQIIKLSQRAAVVFDGPFETYRRFGYSVIALSSLLCGD